MITEELQSKTIDWLRFPLIIGVIFIHNRFGTSSESMHYNLIHYLFSDIFSRISVPMFFIISGFLFFYKKELTLSVYVGKIKSRFKTLFLPYMFWNISILMLNIFVFNIPLLKNEELSFIEIILTNMKKIIGYPTPVCYQLWFLRDLMICVLISPVIYYLLKCLNIFLPFLFSIIWITNGFYQLELWDGLTFFCIGGYFSVHKLNIADYFNKLRFISLLYPVFVFCDMFTKEMLCNAFIHNIGILTGIIFLFNSVLQLLKNKTIKEIPYLSKASFFVYLFHEPKLEGSLINATRLIYQKLNIVCGDLLLITTYFAITLLTVIVALFVYCVLLNIFEKFRISDKSLLRYALGIKR